MPFSDYFDHVHVRVEEREGRGRCLIATKDFPAGSIIFATGPAATIIGNADDLHERCAYCYYCPRAYGAHSFNSVQKLMRCPTCKTAYCQKSCQVADWKDHKHECKLIRSYRNSDQNGSNAYFDGMYIPDNIWYEMILLSRLYRGNRLRKEDEPKSSLTLPESDIPIIVPTLADVRNLEAINYENGTTNISAEALRKGVIPRENGSPPYSERNIQIVALGKKFKLLPEDISEAEMHRDLMAFENNNFTMTDEEMDGFAYGVFPNAAYMNHSCHPNAMITWAFMGNPAPSIGDEFRLTECADRMTMIVRSMTNIREGEEIMISYVNISKPLEERREILESNYGFDCYCPCCEQDLKSKDNSANEGPGPEPLRINGIPVKSGSGEDQIGGDKEVTIERARYLSRESLDLARSPDDPETKTILKELKADGVKLTKITKNPDHMQVFELEMDILSHAIRLFRTQLPAFHEEVLKAVDSMRQTAQYIDHLPALEATRRHLLAALRASNAMAPYYPCQEILSILLDSKREIPAQVARLVENSPYHPLYAIELLNLSTMYQKMADQEDPVPDQGPGDHSLDEPIPFKNGKLGSAPIKASVQAARVGRADALLDPSREEYKNQVVGADPVFPVIVPGMGDKEGGVPTPAMFRNHAGVLMYAAAVILMITYGRAPSLDARIRVAKSLMKC